MANSNQGQEPSMEDILASIRRIIDEDDKKVGDESGAGTAADDDDVLDLTDTIASDDDDILDLGDADALGDEPTALPGEDAAIGLEPEPDSGIVPPPATASANEDTMPASDRERLISDTAVSSAAAALGSLARASDRDPLHGVPQGRPVEALVMELLRPMLREWLDTNLPTIVERIVEREVRYLSRRLGEDDRA